MRSTGESVADRIKKGEVFLNSLAPNDPKRTQAEKNLINLKAQLAEGFTSGLYEPPLIDVDPRTDLSGDSEKWSTLLKMALERDEKMCGVLNGMRCGGTRIKLGRTPTGGYRWILQPDIDPTGRLAWESQKDYEEMRDKYLKPYFGEVTELLRKLEKQFSPIE